MSNYTSETDKDGRCLDCVAVQQTERERFEEWMGTIKKHNVCLAVWAGTDRYYAASTQLAWEAWQEALKRV